MKLLNKLTYKNLILNKKRSIVTIIGIILSVALITAVSSMVSSFKESMINYEKTRKGDYHISFNNVPLEDLKYFDNNRSIESYYVTNGIGYAKLDGVKNKYKPYAYIIEMDKNAFKNTRLQLISGELPKNDTEIVIPRHLKTNGRLTLEIGETITLNVGDRVSEGYSLNQSNPFNEENSEEIINTTPKTYKIVGIVERPSFEYYTAPGYTFVTFKSNSVNGTYDIYARYTKDALKDYQKTTQNIVGDLENPKYSFGINEHLIELETFSFNDDTMKVIINLAIVVIIIVIFTSVFCIKNSFNISITEKIKQYGMLASVGATSKQIKKNVYYEAFLLSIIGIPLGILSGILASFILIKVVNALIGNSMVIEGFLIFRVSILAIIFSIILSIITIFLSSRKASKIASKTSPITAIRNSGSIKINPKKLKTPKLIKKLFGIGGVISYKNIKRNKKKYRTTVISIILCVAVYVALSYFINMAFNVVKMEFGEYTYNLNVYIFKDALNNYDQIENITKLEEIKDYSVIRTSMLEANLKYTNDAVKYNSYDGNEAKNKTLTVLSVGEKEYKKYVDKLNLDYEKVKNKGILINNDIIKIIEDDEAKKVSYSIFDIKIGDIINSKIMIEETEKDFDIEIAKVTDIRPMGYENYYNDAILIVSDEVMDTLPKIDQISIFINCDNPDTLQDEITKMLANFDNYSIANIDSTFKSMNNIYLIVAIFLYGFIIVIALIGVTNIFNTITTNIELRKSEFAMLKSIGMTNHEFNRMIFLESFFYCIKSLLIGLPIGIAISYVIYKVLIGEIEFNYVLPYKGIIISISVVFILIFTLMKYSVNKVKNNNIIETIRNENI